MVESFGEKENSPRPNWLWGIRQVLLNGELLEVPARIKEESLDTSFLRWIPIEKGYEEADFALQVAVWRKPPITDLKRTGRVAR